MRGMGTRTSERNANVDSDDLKRIPVRARLHQILQEQGIWAIRILPVAAIATGFRFFPVEPQMDLLNKGDICPKAKDEIDSITKVLGEEVVRGLEDADLAMEGNNQVPTWTALLATYEDQATFGG